MYICVGAEYPDLANHWEGGVTQIWLAKIKKIPPPLMFSERSLIGI